MVMPCDGQQVASIVVVGLVLAGAVAGVPTVTGASNEGTPTAVFANDSGSITLLMEDGSTKSLGVSGEYAGHMRIWTPASIWRRRSSTATETSDWSTRRRKRRRWSAVTPIRART